MILDEQGSILARKLLKLLEVVKLSFILFPYIGKKSHIVIYDDVFYIWYTSMLTKQDNLASII